MMRSPRAMIMGSVVVAAALWLSAMSWVAGNHISSRNGPEASEGQRREYILQQIAETYFKMSSLHDVGGSAHPPVKHINAELKKRDAKWRVRLDQEKLDTFDIS